MIIDAVDVGNEVRKQYVPRQSQMPEARKSDEVSLSVLLSKDADLKIVVPPPSTPSATESALDLEHGTETK